MIATIAEMKKKKTKQNKTKTKKVQQWQLSQGSYGNKA